MVSIQYSWFYKEKICEICEYCFEVVKLFFKWYWLAMPFRNLTALFYLGVGFYCSYFAFILAQRFLIKLLRKRLLLSHTSSSYRKSLLKKCNLLVFLFFIFKIHCSVFLSNMSIFLEFHK